MREEAVVEQMGISIEVATPADARAMEELKSANLMHRASTGKLEMTTEDRERAKATDESIAKLSKRLENSSPDDYYIVAKSGGKIVGFCRMEWKPETKYFQFQQFYMTPELIGQKIGSKLMAEAKARARASSHQPRGIFLYTGDYNETQEKYLHWGFRHAGPEESKHENRDGQLKVEWVKMVLEF